jgi:two-component system phosphate regulon sensor histidine kinase PhoR
MDTEQFQFEPKTLSQYQAEDVLKKVCAEITSDLADNPDYKQKTITIKLDLPPQSTTPFLSVSQYFEHAIFNLVDNAVKYSKSGGEVKVSLQQIKNKLIVTVKDEGIGIPKAEQSKVFKKFSRATNAHNMYTDGSGLGLFIVKKVIEAHQDGKVAFKSAEDKGAEFTVSVTVATEEQLKNKNNFLTTIL